jgi:agmatinase
MRLITKGLRVRLVVLTICLSSTSFAHRNHDQVHLKSDHSRPVTGPTWLEKYGPQIDQTFSGPLSFSHLQYVRCLQEESTDFDIAILGLPFDTGVSHRPGYYISQLTRVSEFVRNMLSQLPIFSARFGPYAIRSGSRRQRDLRGYSLNWGNNPYMFGQKIIDCGDVGSNTLLEASRNDWS